MSGSDDPILQRFRAALDERYGDRLERVVLFGSRARGDARADSDYDVAVFLKGLDGFGKEAGLIAEIESNILVDTGAVINALPLQEGSYRDRTAFMRELRQDGPRFLTPEATALLAKARSDLDDARKILAIPLATIAARSAYYAAFHAAEASSPSARAKSPRRIRAFGPNSRAS